MLASSERRGNDPDRMTSVTRMKRPRVTLLFWVLFLLVGLPFCLSAAIKKFPVDQRGVRNLGVWRLTHDPVIRDEANYHNTQCWSHDGRYTCYTHWVEQGRRNGVEGNFFGPFLDSWQLADRGQVRNGGGGNESRQRAPGTESFA